MKRIHLPTDESTVRALSVGDEVYLSGRLITARDAAHKLLTDTYDPKVRDLFQDCGLYHCGPVIHRVGEEYRVVAAGPTTSMREEPYEAAFLTAYRPRVIIGKGGMGPRTKDALAEIGAVYVHAVGGAASLLASTVRRVHGVHYEDTLGGPEALWELEVEDFFGIVTMDSRGHSLHDLVHDWSHRQFERLLHKTSD